MPSIGKSSLVTQFLNLNMTWRILIGRYDAMNQDFIYIFRKIFNDFSRKKEKEKYLMK